MKETYLFLKDIGVDLAFMIAGLFGGVAFVSKPNEMTFWQKVLTVLTGIGTANYLTPFALWVLHIPEKLGYGLAFVLGYMGFKAIEYFIKKYQDKQNKKNSIDK